MLDALTYAGNRDSLAPVSEDAARVLEIIGGPDAAALIAASDEGTARESRR